MSRTVLQYARDYIAMGSTLQQRQTYLQSAVLAWNLSLFTEDAMEDRMQASINEFAALNPGAFNIEILRHNLPVLIQRKLAMFPEINRLIVSAQISVENGQECLNVGSTDFAGANR